MAKKADPEALKKKVAKAIAAGEDQEALIAELVDHGEKPSTAKAIVASASKASSKPLRLQQLRTMWRAIHREAMADADYRSAAAALKELDRIDLVVPRAHRVAARNPTELLAAVSAGEVDAYRAVAIKSLLDAVDPEPDEGETTVEALEAMTLGQLSARLTR